MNGQFEERQVDSLNTCSFRAESQLAEKGIAFMFHLKGKSFFVI